MIKITKTGGLMALLILFLCSFFILGVSADDFEPIGPHDDDSESNTFVIGNVETNFNGRCRCYIEGHAWSDLWAVFEWEYNTPITGTITQVQVRGGMNPDTPTGDNYYKECWFGYSGTGSIFTCNYYTDRHNCGNPKPAMDGIDIFPTRWKTDDPLDSLKLYINGEAVGGASDVIVWEGGSTSDSSCFLWDDLNIVCINDTVLFELYIINGKENSMIIIHGADDAAHDPVDVDGDGDRDFGSKISSSNTARNIDGVYNPQYDKTVHVEDAHTMPYGSSNMDTLYWYHPDWDDTYQTDPIYEFTYQQGLGGSANISYNETVLINHKTIEQYDHVYFDCIMNSSLSPNVLTVDMGGTEYVNFTSDRKYFTVHWYPEEIGMYIVNVTRDGSVVAQNTVQVIATESPGAYVYLETFTPVQTGQYVSLFANVTAHMSYEAYLEVFDDGISVFKEYLGSNESMSFDYETNAEGRFDVELRLEKGLGDDNPLVDTAVFYVQDQEKLQTITMNTGINEGETVDISYTNNFGGTHATYLLIRWIDPSDTSTEQQGIFYFKEYEDVIAFIPNKVGSFSCKMYYENVELYFVNFTVTGGSGGTGEDTGDDDGFIIEDITSIWENGAHMFGIEHDMFRLILGAIVVMMCMVLPLLLTSKKIGLSITLPMLSNFNFIVLSATIGVVCAFALGLWDMWIVFLVGIAIIALFVKSMDTHFIGSRGG